MTRRSMIIVLVLVSGIGCEAVIESPSSQELSAPVDERTTVFEAEDLEQGLGVTSTQCPTKGIRQGDGSACQWCNWSWGGTGLISCTLGKGAQATTNARWKTIRYPDLNGDGHSDICGQDATGLRCALSNGASAFGTATIWTPNAFMDSSGWNLASYRDTIQYADLNADGKDDVCGRHGAGIYCALSTGTAFGTPTLWTSAYGDDAYWEEHEYYWRTLQLADVTGDGRADLCARGATGIKCSTSTGTAFGNC